MCGLREGVILLVLTACLLFLQHRALMEELNRSKKDFEKIIQAKNKELEQTKVLGRRGQLVIGTGSWASRGLFLTWGEDL